MNFKKLNTLTYEYNQQNKSGREKLVDLIKKTTDLTYIKAVNSALYTCYFNSFIFDLFAKDFCNVDIETLAKFLFSGNYFDAKNGCYQNYSSVKILEALQKEKLVDNDIKLVDNDKGDFGREKTYIALVNRMNESDFLSCRVCFGADSKSDHAIVVTRDFAGNRVVCDTSYREHFNPDNYIDQYINEENIRWFTEFK